jgi:hypothetical protein
VVANEGQLDLQTRIVVMGDVSGLFVPAQGLLEAAGLPLLVPEGHVGREEPCYRPCRDVGCGRILTGQLQGACVVSGGFQMLLALAVDVAHFEVDHRIHRSGGDALLERLEYLFPAVAHGDSPGSGQHQEAIGDEKVSGAQTGQGHPLREVATGGDVQNRDLVQRGGQYGR